MPKANDWSKDPALQEEIRSQGLRGGLIRTAVIWTPISLLLVGALIFFTYDEITGGDRGSWFFVGVLTLLSVLSVTMGGAALLDLAGSPAVIEGYVKRSWTRTDSFVVRSHYIKIDKQILRVDKLLHGDVGEGDYLRVEFYKHSSIVIRLQKVAPPGRESERAEAAQAS